MILLFYNKEQWILNWVLSNSQKEELQITTKREVRGILGDTFEERWILYTEIIMS